ncbi:MAG TPA: thiolase family protein [Trueperaceae bacterium]
MNAVIAAAVRTPIGAFEGALASVAAPRLGAAVVREVVRRAELEPHDVDLVLMGNVLQAGLGQAPARQAAIHGGLSNKTAAVTLNKMCGSGLEALIQAARAVAVGDAEVAIAGGMESMSGAPYLLPGARGGLRMGNKEIIDSMIHDGLWDAYNDQHMGSCAELCARRYNFSREEQDDFAVCSYRRAQAATTEGRFAEEIVAIEVPGRKGEVAVVREDEGPKLVKFDRIPNLRPAFDKDGTVTAANASTINDGAAALVVCSEEVAHARSLPVLARIRGYSSNAQEPEWFTTAPVGALKKLFEKLDWAPESVDLFEINEAFSVVTMAAMREFDLDRDKVNVNGGAVALGHPIGASGARIVVTLLHALKQQGKKRGVAAICIGGGEALAVGVELA